jgi:LacI family transcriptional regulator
MFGEWSEAWGRHAAKMLLATDFDAVFCGSDQIARGVADALRASGRRVPDDVALVGFDNWDVMALACQPPLTSVDMELEQLGHTAAELLLAAINGETTPRRHVHPCRLVVRDSTDTVV